MREEGSSEGDREGDWEGVWGEGRSVGRREGVWEEGKEGDNERNITHHLMNTSTLQLKHFCNSLKNKSLATFLQYIAIHSIY